MVFSSFEFLFRFLPVFLIIYYLTKEQYRNLVLLLGSLIFYTVGEKEYVILLLASIVINYVIAIGMYPGRETADRPKKPGARQKLLLVLALLFDFGSLFFFKYSGMVEKLPLGISFYTFQIAGYMIDVYRGNVPAEKALTRLGAYITMFPQLVAGPIVNYTEVREHLSKRTLTYEAFEDGLRVLVLGLAAKVVIADRIGLLWNQIQTIGFSSISTPLAWLGAFAYSLQLYFDFAGYSMMAIGLGKMIGFQFPINFRLPYVSKSVSEFWRRWHITLGRWFREYVYIPLGGNRKGKIRTFLNLMIVWALTALWHGAQPNFLIWGAMLLSLLALEKLVLYSYLDESRFAGHLYVLTVVPVTWVAFAIMDVEGLLTYYQRMFPISGQNGGFGNMSDCVKYLGDYGALFLVAILFASPVPQMFYNWMKRKKGTEVALNLIILLIFGLSLYYMAISTNNPFLYFNF